MSKTKSTPLLELLESRKAWEAGDYKVPDLNGAQRQRNEDAAREYARAHTSDPFAYGRVKLHLDRGLEHSADVAADARQRRAQS